MKNKNNKKILKRMLIILIVISLIGICYFYYTNKKEKEISLTQVNPNKIVMFDEFEKLIKSKGIKVIYDSKQSNFLLFEVKKNIKVPQVDYGYISKPFLKNIKESPMKINGKADIMLTGKSEKNPDNCIFVYKTFKPYNKNYLDYALINNVQIIDITPNSLNLSLSAIINILFLSLLLKMGAGSIFSFKINKVKKENVKFKDIAGHKETKEELEFVVDYLKNPAKYKSNGAVMPNGILLYGPPGTGKTLLAKAIAGEAGIPFFECSGSSFEEKYVGVGAQRIRKLFKTAKKNSPCIVFIDEIDSIGGARNVDKSAADQTLNQLLVELDGFKNNEDIICIAATNRLNFLDPALIRPGRFDRHISISLPDIKERKELLELYCANKPVDESVDLNQLASLTFGFSGAAIASFVNEAALIATKKDQDKIYFGNFDESFLKAQFGTNIKKNTFMSEEDLKIIAYHESGHAIAYKLLTKKDITKVTIEGTTSGVGGVTVFSEIKENLRSYEYIANQIMISYAGRCAELILFDNNEKKITTGATGDLECVSELLEDIVCNFGMTNHIHFKLNDSEKSNIEFVKYKEYIGNALYLDTVKLLKDNKGILDKMAEELLKNETLYNKDIDDIIAEVRLNS